MGFIRGAAITLFSFILLISLLLMNLTLVLSWSMHYDIFQPNIKNSAGDFLKNSIGVDNMFTEEEQAYMQNYCLIDSEYNLTYEGYSVIIPCQVIEEGPNAIIDYSIGHVIDEIYYAEYNCELWDCVKNSSVPFVLFSEKAMEYWRGKFILLAIISLVLFALIFFISKNKPVVFISSGILLIISSLPFKGWNWVLNLLPFEFSMIFSVFFAKAHSVFLIILIIGLLFVIFGAVCKLFGWNMDFMNWLSKEPDKKEGEAQKKNQPKQKQKQQGKKTSK